MPTRWIISPMVRRTVELEFEPVDLRGNITGPIQTVRSIERYPKVEDIAEPGFPPYEITERDGTKRFVTPTYTYGAIASDGLAGQVNDIALCLVSGSTMAPLTADSDIIDIFELDYEADLDPTFILRTPRNHGFNARKLNGLRRRLSDRGAVVGDLGPDSPIADYLDRMGQRISPSSKSVRGGLGGGRTIRKKVFRVI